jgi:hypothetical protein
MDLTYVFTFQKLESHQTFNLGRLKGNVGNLELSDSGRTASKILHSLDPVWSIFCVLWQRRVKHMFNKIF